MKGSADTPSTAGIRTKKWKKPESGMFKLKWDAALDKICIDGRSD